MTRSHLALGGVAALLLAVAAHAGGEREEQERLRGTWQMVETGSVGKVLRVDAGGATVIAGDRFTIGKTEYTFRVAPTREPREIDMVIQVGGAKGRLMKGIYKLEKDTLTIHLSLGEGRPASFDEVEWKEKGLPHRVMVFRRTTPDKRNQP
jgi:uncharacterized protein (TIGR03067 family)